MEFLIRQLMDKYHVPYEVTNSQTTQNALAVSCPHCDDGSFHGAVFKTNGWFTCWKCKKSLPFHKFMELSSNINPQDVHQFKTRLNRTNIRPTQDQSRRHRPFLYTKTIQNYHLTTSVSTSSSRWLKYLIKRLPHIDYYHRMQFNPMWSLHPRYKQYVWFPIPAINFSKPTNWNPYTGFIGRNLLNDGPRYITTKYTNIGASLPGIEYVRLRGAEGYCTRIIVVVEGIFDMMAVNTINNSQHNRNYYSAVALLGKKLHNEQLEWLVQTGLVNQATIVFALDRTETGLNEKYCDIIQTYGIKTRPFDWNMIADNCPSTDLADLIEREYNNIRHLYLIDQLIRYHR